MTDSADVNSTVQISSSDSAAGDYASSNSDEKPHTMKRTWAGIVTSSTEHSEESEPEEKKPTFRLQPPMLIHGQAKPFPKSSETSHSSKYKFLQPPKLSAPSSSSSTVPASISEQSIASGTVVSSTNPFLHVDNEDDIVEQQGNENKNIDNSDNEATSSGKSPGKIEVNGNEDICKPRNATDIETQRKLDITNQANPFSQLVKSGPVDFLFGSKMEERVTFNTEVKAVEKNDGNPASEFVFGQNISERAKVSSSSDVTQPTLFALPASSQSTSTSVDSLRTSQQSPGLDSNSQTPTSSDTIKKRPGGLKEDAAACFLASQTRTVIPEVQVVTGEENEKNVLQIQCKLYQFETKTQNWLERGVGSLHLNDEKCSDDDLHFTSRLVMRTHGSLRLVLNTKVWAQMTVEQASKKSIRITAQTDEGSIGVFLINAAINDSTQMYRALEYRIRHRKKMEEKENEAKQQDEIKPESSNPEEDQTDSIEKKGTNDSASKSDDNETTMDKPAKITLSTTALSDSDGSIVHSDKSECNSSNYCVTSDADKTADSQSSDVGLSSPNALS